MHTHKPLKARWAVEPIKIALDEMKGKIASSAEDVSDKLPK